jgi:hypothetical protein
MAPHARSSRNTACARLSARNEQGTVQNTRRSCYCTSYVRRHDRTGEAGTPDGGAPAPRTAAAVALAWRRVQVQAGMRSSKRP